MNKKGYDKEKVLNRKMYLMMLKGNKCACCGNNFITLKTAHFHHIDSATKKHNISDMLNNYSIDKIIEETNKCILLCSHCHINLHTIHGKKVTAKETNSFIKLYQDINK